MKKSLPFALRAILSIVLTTFSLQVWGVDCSSNSISLSTQVDVDNFQSTYGGGGVCDKVRGNLTIDGGYDITSLDGLSSIASVGAKLNITTNYYLTNLDGLSSLTSVAGDLKLYANFALRNLDGLSSLTSIGGNLLIDTNNELSSLDGLSSLTSLGGSLVISQNIFGLTNLDGLSSLTSIGGGVSVSANWYLTDLDGLSSIVSVGGSMSIVSNDSLTNLDGLSSLTSVGGGLYIGDNSLLNLDGLSSLTSIGGELAIGGNKPLSTNSLTNLDGLSNLTSIGGGLSIDGTWLRNLNGLSGLTNTSLDGDLYIGHNNVLSNLDGLSKITSVEGYLWIDENYSLINIDALSNLTSVGGSLKIYRSDALSNLDGLSSLTSVAEYLWIDENYSLANLDGLSNLTSVGGNFWIHYNPVLSRCTALSTLLGWPVGPPYDNVGGNIYLDRNKPGCNSVLEILASVSGLTAPHVTASVISSGQVTLIFSPAYSSDISWPITGYQAQCVAEDQSIATQTGTSPITITGLANNQVYSCSVSAINGQGTGPASNTVSANFTIGPFTIGGHVSDLAGTGLVLRNNLDDDLEISADGSFTFATALYDGSTYSVTVLTQPTGSDKICSIINSNGTVSGADVVDVTVTCFKPNNELRNIATRTKVLRSDYVMIGGFVIVGNEPKCVVVQGLGPSVNVPDGVTRLANPVLQLKSGLTIIAENISWKNQTNPSDVQAIEDSGRAPKDVLEAAIYKCLDPGAYTAVVKGSSQGMFVGTGIVAVYDADDGSSYLKNISTRSWVGTGHEISIAGFVVTGDTPKQVLIRGFGPSMEGKVKANILLLWNPQLRLFKGATVIETNDDWGDAANAAEIDALPASLRPADAREPAILMTLEPGLYTVHLSGVDETTGMGILAVYDLTGRQ